MVLSSFHFGGKTGSSSSLCRFEKAPGWMWKKCEEQRVFCLVCRISSLSRRGGEEESILTRCPVTFSPWRRRARRLCCVSRQTLLGLISKQKKHQRIHCLAEHDYPQRVDGNDLGDSLVTLKNKSEVDKSQLAATTFLWCLADVSAVFLVFSFTLCLSAHLKRCALFVVYYRPDFFSCFCDNSYSLFLFSLLTFPNHFLSNPPETLTSLHLPG